jgi:acyl-CoA thioester hydrolase
MAAESSAGAWFRCRRRVEFRDTDAAGIAHFSAFFFWMESAEHELLRHLGLRVVEHEPDDADALKVELAAAEETAAPARLEVSWPRVSVTADYKAAVRFGEEVDVAVAVAAIGASSVTYAFRFESAGRLVATGRVVAVRCLLRPGRKPQPVRLSPLVARQLTSHLLPPEA